MNENIYISNPNYEIDLYSLGTEFSETTAEWIISYKYGIKVLVKEKIEKNIIGAIYYDILLEAFIL